LMSVRLGLDQALNSMIADSALNPEDRQVSLRRFEMATVKDLIVTACEPALEAASRDDRYSDFNCCWRQVDRRQRFRDVRSGGGFGGMVAHSGNPKSSFRARYRRIKFLAKNRTLAGRSASLRIR
jgi:hypothetical protein